MNPPWAARFVGDAASADSGRRERDIWSMQQWSTRALLDRDMIRLLLVEGQPAIRCGLRMRLKLEPDVTLLGEAGDGLAALAQASVLRPDVILLDIESAGMDGLELVKAIRATSPRSAVVVLSLRDDATIRRQAQAAGAAVFVSKHEYGDRLIQAIRLAAGGQHGLPADSVRPRNVRKALT